MPGVRFVAVSRNLALASPLLPRHRGARPSTDGTAALSPRFLTRLRTAPGTRSHPGPIAHLFHDAGHGCHETGAAAPQPLLHRGIKLHNENPFPPLAAFRSAHRGRPLPPQFKPPPFRRVRLVVVKISSGAITNKNPRWAGYIIWLVAGAIGCPITPPLSPGFGRQVRCDAGGLFPLSTSAGRGLPLAAAHGAAGAPGPPPAGGTWRRRVGGVLRPGQLQTEMYRMLCLCRIRHRWPEESRLGNSAFSGRRWRPPQSLSSWSAKAAGLWGGAG